MDYQNPIDKLWRSLLSSPNQLALARVLKENLINFLKLADRAGILVLHREDLRSIDEVAHDLPRICPLVFSRTYGGSAAARGQSVRQICRQLQESGIDTRLGLKKRQLDQIRRRMQDLIPASSNLLHARNVAAHEHYSIDDPGFALMFAGSIIRIFEVAEISEKQAPQFDKMILIANQLTNACTNLADADDDEATEQEHSRRSDFQSAEVMSLMQQIIERLSAIESLGPTSNNTQASNQKTGRITATDLGPKYVVGQFKRLAADLARQINSEVRSLPTIDEIDSIVRNAVGEVARHSQGHQKVGAQTKEMLENLHSGISQLKESLEARDVNPALEAFYEEKLEPHMSQIQELADRLDEAQSNVPVSWPDESETDQSEDELVDTPSTDTQPSLTAQQAKTQLYLLRNRIRDELEADGEPIENWENILQGPIISYMLRERVTDLSRWKKIDEIEYKYDRNSDVMDKQLKKYATEMFDIMQQIVD